MTVRLRALALTAAITLTLPAAAHAATLATGTLTGASGAPAAGEVRVYAWMDAKKGQTVEMPLLGTATAGTDGRFTVNALDTGQLAQIAARRDGWVDFNVVGSTGTHTARWGFTARVDAHAGQARVSDAEAALAADYGAVAASASVQTPYVNLRATRPAPNVRAAQINRCLPKVEQRNLGVERKLTHVGELNNAYNDGTVGTFVYARNKTAETHFGLAVGVPVKGGKIEWSIGEEYLVANSGEVTFPPAKKRYSRKLRSLFEYTKWEVRQTPCAVWEPMIKATSWLGDDDSTIKQDGLDKCDPGKFVGLQGGGRWKRNQGTAVRFTRAVEAFGVNLTARSGFTENVSLEYVWGGPESKRHFLCGQDGKQSPMESGRVFSGARK